MRKCVLWHMRKTKVQISTFVVRCLDSMICILALSKVSRFYQLSIAEQAGLNLTWSKFPEDTFSRDVVHMIWEINTNKIIFSDFSDNGCPGTAKIQQTALLI